MLGFLDIFTHWDLFLIKKHSCLLSLWILHNASCISVTKFWVKRRLLVAVIHSCKKSSNLGPWLGPYFSPIDGCYQVVIQSWGTHLQSQPNEVMAPAENIAFSSVLHKLRETTDSGSVGRGRRTRQRGERERERDEQQRDRDGAIKRQREYYAT